MQSGFLYSQGASSDTSEDINASVDSMAQRVGAGGFGLVDAAVGTYNWLMPGEDNDIKRSGILAPFKDKPHKTMRDLSAAILPELMIMVRV